MYELREEYQLPAHNATVEHCKVSNEPAFHSMSVGAGKTINIAFLCQHIANKNGRVLVLARQGELISQNSEDCWAIKCKNSVYSASLNKKSTFYPVIFGTEGTIQRALDTDFKSLKFGALLIDECHMIDWQDCLLSEPESQYGKIIKHFRTLNPQLRIIGYTGSPYRGKESIKGDFWKHQLSDVSTYELIGLGFLVPPVFGFGDDDHSYDLKEFSKADEHEDYTQKELAAMGRAITKDSTRTAAIMEEVVERTRNGLGVLITCASKKHCQQVSECLPGGTWGIVTDSTSTKERIRILNDAKTGKIKYVMQIGCLTTGVNVPFWQYNVLLRKIGSLTLLTQLIGRTLRTLKPHQIEEGLVKHDSLILDYAETFESMGDIFDDPIIQQAVAKKKGVVNENKQCPKCNTMNSEYAVRCYAQDTSEPDGRCSYFFKSSVCACGTENAPTAKNCRACDAVMIDPNKALVNKAYTDADYKGVKKMELSETTTGKLCVTYCLETTYQKNGKEYPEVAKEYFNPIGGAPFEKQKWYKFIEQHIQGASFRRTFAKLPSIKHMVNMKAMLDIPKEITHRMNDKHFSIINRKKFNTGREELNG